MSHWSLRNLTLTEVAFGEQEELEVTVYLVQWRNQGVRQREHHDTEEQQREHARRLAGKPGVTEVVLLQRTVVAQVGPWISEGVR